MVWFFGFVVLMVVIVVFVVFVLLLEMKLFDWVESDGGVCIFVGVVILGLICFDNVFYQCEFLDMIVNLECYWIMLKWGVQVGKMQFVFCV